MRGRLRPGQARGQDGARRWTPRGGRRARLLQPL